MKSITNYKTWCETGRPVDQFEGDITELRVISARMPIVLWPGKNDWVTEETFPATAEKIAKSFLRKKQREERKRGRFLAREWRIVVQVR
ncbi:MAG TPA: hypothetical protein VJJ22_04010 [Candidatus Paceibacterota bacterium]